MHFNFPAGVLEEFFVPLFFKIFEACINPEIYIG